MPRRPRHVDSKERCPVQTRRVAEEAPLEFEADAWRRFAAASDCKPKTLQSRTPQAGPRRCHHRHAPSARSARRTPPSRGRGAPPRRRAAGRRVCCGAPAVAAASSGVGGTGARRPSPPRRDRRPGRHRRAGARGATAPRRHAPPSLSGATTAIHASLWLPWPLLLSCLSSLLVYPRPPNAPPSLTWFLPGAPSAPGACFCRSPQPPRGTPHARSAHACPHGRRCLACWYDGGQRAPFAGG